MTGEAKLNNIAAQIKACEEGRTNVITCPYCNIATFAGDAMCCKPIAVAISAILDRKELEERLSLADQIVNKVLQN
jgi:hypothetical protein